MDMSLKRLIFLTFLIRNISFLEARSNFAGRNYGSRIIGGQPATKSQFKFAAGIHVKTADSTFFCGGALTGKRWIITSGNCAYNAVNFSIQLGSNQLSGDDENRYTVFSSKYHLHPNFDSSTIDNDIAVIELEDNVPWNGYIQPLYLSSINHVNSTEMIALGFGQTSDRWFINFRKFLEIDFFLANSDLSDELMFVNVTTISNDECKMIYGSQITENMICVVGTTNEGTCTGDNGGPLVITYTNGQYYSIAAVASFISGNGCESSNPSGYTRIYPYIYWILDITGPPIETLNF